MALCLAEALHYMHTAFPYPLAHLDVKSPNVLLDLSSLPPSCKLTDFGTSKFIMHPLTECFVDNPTWLAPETFQKKIYDETVDVYAFGLFTWQLVARQIPFSHIPFLSDVERALSIGRRPEIPFWCPRAVQQIITRCWAQVPKSRPKWTTILSGLQKIKKAAPRLEQDIGVPANQRITLLSSTETVDSDGLEEKIEEREREEIDEGSPPPALLISSSSPGSPDQGYRAKYLKRTKTVRRGKKKLFGPKKQ